VRATCYPTRRCAPLVILDPRRSGAGIGSGGRDDVRRTGERHHRRPWRRQLVRIAVDADGKPGGRQKPHRSRRTSPFGSTTAKLDLRNAGPARESQSWVVLQFAHDSAPSAFAAVMLLLAGTGCHIVWDPVNEVDSEPVMPACRWPRLGGAGGHVRCRCRRRSGR
jgi:hypothetical protein